MEQLARISRQFAEWGIALQSKYRSDLFFRTTLYVVGLQTGLVVVFIIAFSYVLNYTNAQVVDVITAHITTAPGSSVSAFSPILPQSIDAIQNASVRLMFLGIIVGTIFFGILLAYVTLRPARNSLQYQKLFISNVAHELRTPLSTIKMSTEVALLDPDVGEESRKIFNDTLVELDRISDIINNLLSLNRFLRPERMEFVNVDLGPVIENVTSRLAPLADQYHIDVQVKKSEYCTVVGNATGLEQVLTNLVKNAISYTPRGRHGVVTVTAEPDYRGSIVVSVADNGVGIAEKDLFHIFEPFYRADLSRTRRVKHAGSGLGLAIVSEIVRAHQGRIRIQSAVGKGTTVYINLPAGKNPSGEELHPGAGGEGLNEVSVDFSKSRPA